MADFSTAPLSSAEQTVADCVAEGREATFVTHPDRKPNIRAALIRHLLLHGRPPGKRRPGVEWLGVRISGANIDGPLDLADYAQPGPGLPALVLEKCDIWDPVDLSASRLARLSLAGSRFTFVDLREANIDGPFDFSGAGWFDRIECWIDARGALIAGDVIGAGATLRVVPTAGARRRASDSNSRHALWLAGSTVRGSVRLVDGFVADGGVSLDAGRVTGDVRVADAILASQEGDALSAQNADINGVMLFRNIVANGTVWLHGLRTGGVLQFSEAWIYGETPPLGEKGQRQDTPDEQCNALIVGDADIGGSVRLTPRVTVHGRVSFAASKIRGSLNATAAQFFNYSTDCRVRAVDAANLDIGANMVLDKGKMEGRLDLAGARIGGKLSFRGAWLYNHSSDGAGRALEAQNVTVGGPVEFGRDGSSADGAHIFGQVDLTGMQVGGDLAFAGAIVDNLAPEGEGVAIMARQLNVRASIRLNHKAVTRGAVILTGATVGRDLLCHHVTLSNPERSALYAKDIEIGDDLRFLDSDVAGNLRFERAEVKGSVHWRKLKLQVTGQPRLQPDEQPRLQPGQQPRLQPGQQPRLARLELRHAQIGSRLACEGIEFVSPSRIDLRDMRVATVDLSRSPDWGEPRVNNVHCPLALDGLVYDRILLPNHRTAHTEHVGNAAQHNLAAQRDLARQMLRKRARIPHGYWRRVGPPPDDQADPLLDWLLRDSTNDTVQPASRHLVVANAGETHAFDPWERFNPQPYRQLARVLRAQGYERAARYIAIYEQWATPRTSRFSRGLYFVYGAMFGFGLWPWRAVVTFVAYLAIGWLSTYIALEKKWLNETPTIATASYTMEKPGEPERAFILAPVPVGSEKDQTKHELACIDVSNWLDALVYAFDTVLPFIPLHLETKCELHPELHWQRLIRAVYAVAGWVVTSLALLTFSGIVRRFDSDAA